MIFALPYPAIDPVLISIGPFAIRWYALAYIGGLLLGWRYLRWLAAHPPQAASGQDVDDFLMWATLGVVLGGRFGYVLFYQPGHYLAHPGDIFRVWEGGMSFHGGFLGVVILGYLFTRRRRIPFLAFSDMVAVVTPIGLFLGRLANFINGELWGRVTDAPWGVVFPGGGPHPRHPSQLYEATLEGLVLFVVLHLVWRRESLRRRAGLLTGVLFAGYGLARSIVELFRQPDVFLGFLAGGTTMGQWLSLPMVLAGVALIATAKPGARP